MSNRTISMIVLGVLCLFFALGEYENHKNLRRHLDDADRVCPSGSGGFVFVGIALILLGVMPQ